MKVLLIIVLALIITAPCVAQTTVNLSVTDTPDNQAWKSGTWSVQIVPTAGNLSQTGSFTLTGGGSLASQSGTLSATGTASLVLPATANIAPTSQWQFTVCPQPSNNTNCFQQSVTVSTTTPQALALAPPSIRINLAVATPPVSAYSTGEISGAVIGSQFYLLGTGIQVCSVVSGNTCTTWVASGGSVEGSSITGVFTSGQMNQPALFTLNGGGTCNTQNIVNLGGAGTSVLTDAWSACVNLPTTGVTNGFSNGFGSYLKNNNSNNAGQFGWTGAVGYYSQVWCQAGTTNNRCWGANFSTSDTGAASGGVIYGTEFDVTPCCTTTTGAGLLMSMRGTNQISADNYPAIQLQSSGTGNFWTSGLQCGTSTLSGTATNPYTCVEMGKQTTGNVDSSQLHFTATGATGAVRLLQDNYMLLDITPAWTVHNPTGREQFGVALTATATLAVNTLVKIDTANADSVVICTTADTSCDGFVVGGSVYCAAGGTHCGINTVPGSKAQGILGTGTCAIGNFVVVDTTTNGRIKCQAGIPAQGAYIGKAISAQVTVGNLVDILTKFQ